MRHGKAVSLVSQHGSLGERQGGFLVLVQFCVFCAPLKGFFLFCQQAVYVISTLPYIVLAIFFVRAVTLKGSVDGIIHMFKPQVIY